MFLLHHESDRLERGEEGEKEEEELGKNETRRRETKRERQGTSIPEKEEWGIKQDERNVKGRNKWVVKG